MENPQARKGRPPIPETERRVKISTTIPPSVKEYVETHNVRYTELIQDGIEHRVKCATLYERIGRLQTIIEEKNIEIARLQGGTPPSEG